MFVDSFYIQNVNVAIWSLTINNLRVLNFSVFFFWGGEGRKGKKTFFTENKYGNMRARTQHNLGFDHGCPATTAGNIFFTFRSRVFYRWNKGGEDESLMVTRIRNNERRSITRHPNTLSRAVSRLPTSTTLAYARAHTTTTT